MEPGSVEHRLAVILSADTWGFRDRVELAGADWLVDEPGEILEIVGQTTQIVGQTTQIVGRDDDE